LRLQQAHARGRRSTSSRSSRTAELRPASFPLLLRWRRLAIERAFARNAIPGELVGAVLSFLGGPPAVLLTGSFGLAFIRTLLPDNDSPSWGAVTTLAVEPSLGWLVCSLERSCTTYLWDLDCGNETVRGVRRYFEGLAAEVTSVGLGHDGRHAAGSRDGSLRLWDARTGDVLAAMSLHIWPQYTFVAWGHTCAVKALALPPAAAPCYSEASTLPWLVLSGGLEGSLCMWDATGTCCFCVDADDGASRSAACVSAVAWAGDGLIALAAVGWAVVGYNAGASLAAGKWPTSAFRLGFAPWDEVPASPVSALHVLPQGLLATDFAGGAAFWGNEALLPVSPGDDRPSTSSKRAMQPRLPRWRCRSGSGPRATEAAAPVAMASGAGCACWSASQSELRWLQDGLLLRARLPLQVQGAVWLGPPA